jgi:hypothetical protein
MLRSFPGLRLRTVFNSNALPQLCQSALQQHSPNHNRYFAMTVPQHPSLRKVEINVDCGEGFGQWEGGPDEDLMPMIDVANVACGGHAGSPLIMMKTVALAKRFGVKVGARKSLLPCQCSRRLTSLSQIPVFLTRRVSDGA